MKADEQRPSFQALIFSLGALALAACGPQPGTLQMTIYGEEFIEEGIPSDVFSDKWSMKFDKFLVSVGSISAGAHEDHSGAPALSDNGYRVFDLSRPSQGAGHKVTSATVPGGLYHHVGYRVAPPPSGSLMGNASAADMALMQGMGYAIYVEATATREQTTKKLRWGFATKTRYGECESTAMVDGAPATSQITIHADHLFYDDLFSSEPNVSFDLVAGADKDNDGVITAEEVKAVDLRKEARYQVGSTGIKDLWAYIEYQTGTVGHIDGEGHCASTTRE